MKSRPASPKEHADDKEVIPHDWLPLWETDVHRLSRELVASTKSPEGEFAVHPKLIGAAKVDPQQRILLITLPKDGGEELLKKVIAVLEGEQQ